MGRLSKLAQEIDDARKTEDAYTLRAAMNGNAKEFKKWTDRWSQNPIKRKRAREGKSGKDLGKGL